MNDLLRKAKQYLGNREGMSKLLKKENFILIFLIGVLLMVIRLPVTEKGSKKNTGEAMEKENVVYEAEGISIQDYETVLEERTREILSEIDHVGEVTVMITFRNEGRQIVEKDLESVSSTEKTKDAAGGTQENIQSEISQTTKYYTDETGKEVPFVNETYLPQVEGILIVAQGGDDQKVNLQISQACQALFGIEAHKIVIVKGNALGRRTE